jgi:hypothetical protein
VVDGRMVAVSSGTVELQAKRIMLPKSRTTIRIAREFSVGFINFIYRSGC